MPKNVKVTAASIKKRLKEAESKLHFYKGGLLASMTEKEKNDFLSSCSILFSNPALRMVCDDLYTNAILSGMGEALTFDHLMLERGKIFGINDILKEFEHYHMEYLDLIKKKEEFDKHETV